MDKSKRKAIIAGNWKMNKTPKEAKELLNAITPLVKDAGCEVIACVPYVDLATALEATEGTNVKIGAENCHWAESGAFTGEISTGMLKEMGVEYVVLGHSERRQYFGETDETVNKRTKAALAAGLKPIVCVGELLWERECDITEEVIARQIKLDLFNVTEEELKMLLSLMSLYGLSAQAKLLQLIRLKKFALSSVLQLLSFTIRLLLTLLQFSTAVQ